MTITHRPTFTIPNGKLPNSILSLQPGDLIFGMAGADFQSKLICKWQMARHYPPRSCDATHVAMYIGNGDVAHAVLPEARIEPVMTYFAGRDVSVARWRVPQGMQRSRANLGDELRLMAKHHIGRPYEWVRMLGTVLSAKVIVPDAPFVCSTFVDLVFDSVFGHLSPLSDGKILLRDPFITPAHLFAQETLI